MSKINIIKNYLKEIGLNNNEIKVYLALTQLGEATAAIVAKKADLPRTTAMSILNKLALENYLTTHKYRGKTYYWIESPKTIANILETKIDLAQKLNELLTGLYRTESHFPVTQVYDSKRTIKQFIEKLLVALEKKTVIQTIDAPGEGNYSKIYADQVRSVFLLQKKKKEIVTNTLVPFGSTKGIADYKLKNQLIKIKELPKGIDFKASLWLVKDKLILFSGNPPYLVVIKHEIIVPSLKSLYAYLWQISTPKN